MQYISRSTCKKIINTGLLIEKVTHNTATVEKIKSLNEDIELESIVKIWNWYNDSRANISVCVEAQNIEEMFEDLKDVVDANLNSVASELDDCIQVTREAIEKTCKDLKDVFDYNINGVGLQLDEYMQVTRETIEECMTAKMQQIDSIVENSLIKTLYDRLDYNEGSSE